ncbi:11630_t:CDS:2 [Funneliformis caledonium]|uniref:11630_t:CDS:1 n=1 Tax=Funneliformis caledonium TaxID=1117310 RepID=A0A9N9D2K4_9GLOM|nr:11630_t:CDS:2 [Funneliformis caledonium]
MPSFVEINNSKFHFSRLDIIKGVEQLDKKFVDLASSNLGGKIIECSDEFFAEASNLLKPHKPVRKPGKYTERGSWMDGWESKRHNPFHDWVVIKLGFEGHITGFDIDTSYFEGNQAPMADVEACFSPNHDYDNNTNIQKTTMKFTHVRLNIYPDGGVARFRVYGIVSARWPKDHSTPVDLAYAGNEGRIISYSDQHYGKSDNILLPGRGKDMSDGWETRRSRQPNHNDWIIIKLGCPGYLEKAEVDTAFFKGNYPDRVLLEGCFCNNDVLLEDGGSNVDWDIILEKSKLGPHKQHYFDLKKKYKKFSHVKMTIFPDGGVKRLRIIGRRELTDKVDDNFVKSELSEMTHSSVVHIVATPLTYASFSPYGNIIQSFPEQTSTQNSFSITHGIKVTPANQGTARKYNHVASVINYRQSNILLNKDQSSDKTRVIAKAVPNLSLYKCSPVKSLPFTVRLLERHPYSSQTFLPLSDGKVKGYLVVVCLNNDVGEPDLSTLKAFIASSIQGINYHPGIWHHPMIALEKTTEFACLTHESGIANEDCEEIEFEEKDFVVVNVPGFH